MNLDIPDFQQDEQSIYTERTCPVCGTKMLRTQDQERRTERAGSTPTCSRKCRGKLAFAKRPNKPTVGALPDMAGRYSTRTGAVAVVEGQDEREEWPLYGYIERWHQGSNREWRLTKQLERWRADGTWGESEPFELDLMVAEEEVAA